MEQKAKMCQSHHAVTHRNGTYARATTRAHSQELGSHVAGKEGYLARTLVTLIGKNMPIPCQQCDQASERYRR